jgi:hypothetical protein
MLKALGLSVVILVSSATAYAQSDPSAFLSKVNKDNDKTLSLGELNTYAAARFGELNTKGTKSLSRTEVGDRLSDSDFKIANNGNEKDMTLTEHEFIKYVDHLFKEANAKGHKTLSAAELNSPAGQKLIRLLQ